MRRHMALFLSFGLGLASVVSGCASNLECSNAGTCICREGECVQSCPGGGCTLECMGTDCRLDCPGGDCRLQCAPGAESCVLTGCTSGCNVECAGAPTCTSSCDMPACYVQP